MPPAKKKPSKEEIEALYHLPIAEAAQQLGICKTLLKQVCRKLDIEKWPYKKNKMNKKKTSGQSDDEEPDSYPKETFHFRPASPTSHFYINKVTTCPPFIYNQNLSMSVSPKYIMPTAPVPIMKQQPIYGRPEIKTLPLKVTPQRAQTTQPNVLPSFKELLESVQM